MKNTRGKRTVAGNGIRTKTGREERNEGRKEIEEVLNKYELDFFKNTQMPSDSLIFPSPNLPLCKVCPFFCSSCLDKYPEHILFKYVQFLHIYML